MMNRISPTQKKLLNLYKSFQDFCNKNNLRFYAVAGTAIGAVRHHGFIPWDDDIDLGMPITDFERLQKLTKKLPPSMGFMPSPWMGGKIYDTKTTVIDVRSLTHPNRYHGIYIDIFPLIGLPEEEAKRDHFIEDIKSFKTNAELLEYYPEVSNFSAKQIKDWRNYLIHAYDFETSSKLAGFSYFLCDGAGMRSPIIMQFEDTTIPISSNYDWDLTNHFGDYMTPPPADQRRTHNTYHFLDLKNPYSKYITEYSKISPWLKEIIEKKQIVEGQLTQYKDSLLYESKLKESAAAQSKLEILNSRDYKLGRKILAPFRKIKKGLQHGK